MLVFIWFLGLPVWAHPDTSAIRLPEVTVESVRSDVNPLHTSFADSLMLRQLPAGNLSELLQANHAVVVKTHGPGLLSTSSIRGLSAQHTGVVWNGIPLQNPMLGQMGLELTPNWFVNQVALQSGNQSTAYGSGCAGGIVHLQSKKSIQGIEAKAFSQYSSLGLWSSGLGVGAGNGKSFVAIRALVQDGPLNFSYREPYSLETKRRTHHHFTQQGIQVDAGTQLSKSTNIWYSGQWLDTKRQLPGSVFSSLAYETQQDKSGRHSLNLAWTTTKTSLRLRQGWVAEQMHYINPMIGLNSHSQFQQAYSEVDFSFQLRQNMWMGVIGNGQFTQAQAAVYQANENRLATTAFVRWQTTTLHTMLSLRKEMVAGATNLVLPFSPAVSTTLALSNNLELLAKGAGIYRQPTLNDRFWTPGGNRDLLPESGFTSEAGLNWKAKVNNFLMENQVVAFYNVLKNRIIWLPAGSFWQAQNMDLVHARGLEWRHQMGYSMAPQRKVVASIQHTYTQAENLNRAADNDAFSRRQLIFQPRYVASGQLLYQHHAWQVQLLGRYNSKTFTQTDHSGYLDAMVVADLLLGYQTTLFKNNLHINGKIGNLFNQSAQTLEGFPMPLRYFQLNLLYTFQHDSF